jgi:hypothetical protein
VAIVWWLIWRGIWTCIVLILGGKEVDLVAAESFY